ncbi:hypothetical protein CL617_00290 [archaeon]|nr:hypothetical protein [archaeon]|tara:strand:- start:1336 stop:3264 length:1929 start_codon:yes stop_codon:yes gene_type:complete
MEKRGQVTMFIIIGIVIVVALAVIFTFRGLIFTQEVDQQDREQVLNEAIKPVKVLVDSCIKELGNNAVELIGLQGGYIDVPEDTEPVNPLIPFSRSLDFFNNGVLEIPYWFYETDNGIQEIEVPKLEEMETRIENYIEGNINSCLDNTTSFQEYDFSRFENTNVNAVIGDKSVIIKVKSKLNVNYKELDQEIKDFNVVVESSLGELYKIGKDIFNDQNKNLFFEDKTYDIMSVYKDEIPIGGVEFSCGVKTWNYQDIYNDFTEIISANIPQFKITGTNYEDSDRFYLWKDVLRNQNYNDVNVNFLYSKQWPTFLDVNPRSGNILRTNNANSGNKNPFLSLLCMQFYNFIYDAKYPILISLTDDRGYTFQYPIQVILKNNQPREALISTDYGENILNEQFCDNRVNEVSVNAKDKFGNNLENVDISYQCANLVCDIGKTFNGNLNEKFPVCVNGFVIGNKEGYAESKRQISTDLGNNVFLEMKEIFNKEIKVLNNGFDLKNNEEALVTFEHVDNDFLKTINFPELKNVELIEGDYEVSVMIVKEGDFVINGEKKTQCIKVPRGSILGLAGFTKKECFDIDLDDLSLDSLVIGRSEFTMFATLFDLQDDNTLIVDIDTFSVPKNYDNLQETFSNLTFGSYNFER